MVYITMTHDIHQGKPTLDAPTGRTIMLIHGMWSRPHVWANFRHYLEDHGYRVIVPTLRHHHAEPDEPSHPELGTTSLLDYAADLEREIRLLDEKPFIIGHSMGGTLAQMMAARGLTRGNVLLATAHCAPVLSFNRTVWNFFLREAHLMSFWRRTQRPSYRIMRDTCLNGLNERDAQNLYSTLVPESGRITFELALWFLDRRRAALIDARKIDCPMLMLTGTDDYLTPLSVTRRLAEYYGHNARLEELPGRSHWLPLEPGWQEVAERARHFIEHEAPLYKAKTGAEPAPALEPQIA
ncbi:MAG: alpha/beta hydrolase [Parvibaculum sp.]